MDIKSLLSSIENYEYDIYEKIHKAIICYHPQTNKELENAIYEWIDTNKNVLKKIWTY
jgi:hypothetical protein